jgi:hypothetical protein
VKRKIKEISMSTTTVKTKAHPTATRESLATVDSTPDLAPAEPLRQEGAKILDLTLSSNSEQFVQTRRHTKGE